MMPLSSCSLVCLRSSWRAGSPIVLSLALNFAPGPTTNEHVSTSLGVGLGLWSQRSWCLMSMSLSLSYISVLSLTFALDISILWM